MAEKILQPMNYRQFGVTVRGFAPRNQVFNRYILQRLLGSGGMGVVWLAQDQQLGRSVALKFLVDALFHDPTALEELKRETRKCLELTHQNIVRVYDFIQDKDWVAISMEYVDGDTLRNLQLNKPLGVYETPELERWIWQLTDALEYAHNTARLAHRDLKPANLILTRRGDLKIADFGIARNVSDGRKNPADEVSGIGTPVYMSPQQANGDEPTVLDDVYSLGCTLYELLTGRPPFYEGDITHQVLTRIAPTMTRRREEMGIPGAPIPKCWEDTVSACLAKRPEDRPKTVRDVASGLYPQSRFATAVHALLGAPEERPLSLTPAPFPSPFRPATTTRQAVAATRQQKTERPTLHIRVRKPLIIPWKLVQRIATYAAGVALLVLVAIAGVRAFSLRSGLPTPKPQAPHASTTEAATPSLPAKTDLASEAALVAFLDALRNRPASAVPPAPGLAPDQMEIDAEARLLFEQSRFQDAAAAYRRLLETDPANAYLLANLAAVLAHQQEWKSASGLAQRAVTLEPNHPFARTTLGTIQHAQGLHRDAIDTLAAAVSLDPGNADARLSLGNAASACGWTALAERQFLESIRLQPNRPDAHHNLAVLYTTANPPLLDRARKHYARAKQLGMPPDPALDQMLK